MKLSSKPTRQIFRIAFAQWETHIFYGFLLLGLFPLFLNRYFVTLDGPSHLYNGMLLKTLLEAGDAGEISRLYSLNPFPVPNLLTHWLFAGFSVFLPDFLTEKAVLFIYLFFTPLIFRKLILLVAPQNGVFSWLMILFVHNQNFYFGFFNFSFGLLFLFLTLYYFLKHRSNFSLGKIFVLGLLFLLTYFSHLMVFLISFALIAGLSLTENTNKRNSRLSSSEIKAVSGRLVKMVLSALPALILAFLYLLRFDSLEDHPQRMELKKMLEWIVDIRPLLALRYGFPWKSFTWLLFILLMIMLAVRIVTSRKKGRSAREETFPDEFPVSWIKNTLLVWTSGLLVMFLVVPNAILLSERLILLFFLFFISWLATGKYPGWLHITAVIIILVFHISFTRMYNYTLGGYSKDVMSIKEAVKDIPTGSLVLPLNYNEKWVYLHISGYVGTDKPLALLENYESSLSWFPVRSHTGYYRGSFLIEQRSEHRNIPCDQYLHGDSTGWFSLLTQSNKFIPIPFVLVINAKDGDNSVIPECVTLVLDKHYLAEKSNDFCTLYRLKNESEP